MDDALVTRLFEETTKALTEAPSVDIRELELPLARIKRIMKLEDEVQSQLDGRKNMMVSSEAPVVFAKACELFIREITTRAWTCTEENKRRTLQRSDVATAVGKCDMYDFLIDVVPRDVGGSAASDDQRR
ncbi:histone-like transcription factor [Aureococcus anophagefferens]|uniref:Histone-like transcription factor n=2 Tax=Aureococcus anophagefferens TaxID=44056 RepID=A0ABR1G773_AURAN